ncbi:DUF4267 domain-containing protein [Streptomyces hirsutus]|uniref:DUF4267 domain-containing protein n=1 Tax=Streptomyces hirsutus TaxID=35620 RepID=UPI0034399374
MRLNRSRTAGRQPASGSGSLHLLGWFMLAATGIPASDALIALRSNRPKAATYGIHGGRRVS